MLTWARAGMTVIALSLAQPLLLAQGGHQEKADRPRNIILLIGDGMGTAQIYAGLTANHGSLNLERCTTVGFHKNQSSDSYVTDSGAGATAFSTGVHTYNGAIGVDATRHVQPTILEQAVHRGMATGLVVSCSITHATPAAFYAHQPSRSKVEDIAADLLKTDLTLFIGGGRKHFHNRADGRDLIDSLKKRGYQVRYSLPEILQVRSGKLAGFIADEEPPKVSEGRGDQLPRSVTEALRILPGNPKGFFLMVEGSQIDWGGHARDGSYVVSEMVDFDKAIGIALDFAKTDKHTLVIITADHETGGMALMDGNMEKGTVVTAFLTTDHTGVMIPVFAYGPGAGAFSGIYQNTDIYRKMKSALGL
jgi:alkaline phosphatase